MKTNLIMVLLWQNKIILAKWYSLLTQKLREQFALSSKTVGYW